MGEFDIGFLGGGQLARMSIQAAQRMGLRCVSLDPQSDSPASKIAASVVGNLHDPNLIAEIFRRSSRVTLENEFIPSDAIIEATAIAKESPEKLLPGVECLATIQDKLLQRLAYAAHCVPSPTAVQLTEETSKSLSYPCVLKARFGGYDGKGTITARSEADVIASQSRWLDGSWLAEEFVPFKRELAVMVFRTPSVSGTFPTVETVQTDHVCDLVFPSGVDASEVAIAAVEAVGGFGLFGVELFELENGDLVVNEIAPRPHNTGHYTLDWGATSQFEQHIRLVSGLAIGSTDGRAVCMANLLGQPNAGDYRYGISSTLTDSCVRFHWYGKSESRPGRKMGHLNVVGPMTFEPNGEMLQAAVRARTRFYEAWTRP